MSKRAFDKVAAGLPDAVAYDEGSADQSEFHVHSPDLDGISSELRVREPIFHRREFGTTREDLLRMTTDDFWEIGASGRIYDREFVISNLLERYKTPEPSDCSCDEFSIRQIAENLYQLSYVLLQLTRRTRRTTLWRKTAEGWKIVFHQGTVIS